MATKGISINRLMGSMYLKPYFKVLNMHMHLQEPSQNCSSNGRHLAEEFNGMYT